MPPPPPPRPRPPPPRPRPPPPGYVDHIEWQGIVVIVSLALGILTMGFDLVPPDVVCAGLMAFYTAATIITVKEAAAGFSNVGLLTVMALYVVAEGVARTGGLERLMTKFLGRTRSSFWALFRLQFPIMFVSAFLNNTPIVVLMIPILMAWCRRVGISAKQMLIPLSHLTVFGGTITLIGTSTNLVVSALQAQRYPRDPRLNTFNIFTITPYGFPYALWGASYIILFARFLLPNEPPSRTTGLLVALRVLPYSAIANGTLQASGIKLIDGLSLIGIGQAGTVTKDPPNEFVITVGDILYFTGDLSFVESVSKQFGLTLVTSDNEEPRGYNSLAWPSNAEQGAITAAPAETSHLYEATVRAKGKVAGNTIRTIGFRGKYQAAVVAIHHADGEEVTGKLGDIILKPGDRLILDAGDNFNPESPEIKESFYDVGPIVADFREFTVGFTVLKGDLLDTFVGKTIATAGLRGIPGLFLTSITTASGEVLHAVSPDTKLALGDTLWFAGNVDGIQYLLKQSGLAVVTSSQIKKQTGALLERRLVQAVIGPRSPLVDKTPQEVEFRTRFDATVLAIHRKGERLQGIVSHIKMQVGDVLLLDTGAKFLPNYQDDKSFLLISEVPNSGPYARKFAWVAVALATAMVLTQVIGGFKNAVYIDLWPCAILTGILMCVFRCLTFEQARRSIMWDIFLTIGSTFAIGVAMDKTSIASKIADVAATASRKIGGQTAALSAIYICTAFLSELLSNNSAAAIFYPIASRLGDKLGIDPIRVSVVVMLGASAGWILPWGYQCNLMVFIAGNYRAREFMRLGVPLVFWLWAGATFIFALMDHYWIAIVISVVWMTLIAILGLFWHFIPNSFRETLHSIFLPDLKKFKFGRVHSGGSGSSNKANPKTIDNLRPYKH